MESPPSTSHRAGEGGVTVAELVITVGVVAVLASIAIATVGGSREAIAAAGAARYLSGRLHQIRASALARGVHVALVFTEYGADFCYATVVDGNRNGVRTAEIPGGTDRQVEPCERLGDHFEGVTFGIGPGVTDPDSNALLSGNPLRLGGSTVLSYGPDGAATSGTMYLRGRSGLQYAVRILGATGRSRILRFETHSRQWGPA